MKSRVLLLMFTIAFFCQCQNGLEEAWAINGNIVNERSEQEELDLIKEGASTFEKNSSGFWEATFDHGITMIYVPEGTFTIGNNKLGGGAAPEHEMTLSAYWISKTPITLGQFRAFVKETGYVTQVEKPGDMGSFVYDFSIQGFKPTPGFYWDNAFHQVMEKYPEITINDQHPVNSLSWNDCIAFTDWLAKKTGLSFILPTEAEWEYAARGTDGRIYPWGNDDPDGTRANYADETFDKYFPNTGQSIVHNGVDDGFAITSPVGSFPNGKSPFGALDMAGNLTEWVFDSHYIYTDSLKVNPINPVMTDFKIMKAGFWAGSAGRYNLDLTNLSLDIIFVQMPDKGMIPTPRMIIWGLE
ncbi:SUMF1/EgtB/PvdO family nonheme iron enzyme [Ulvibacterium sp.]|uniref:formylglycine-generating enzyme family protein n=1 Tax=Ulvibacterium sp. TaxID=2665914 RepID=UPI002612C31B|nr:SUMF1/EgtB/PvdO family nonheme iron enzyme [Ulvibacterium sp.]